MEEFSTSIFLQFTLRMVEILMLLVQPFTLTVNSLMAARLSRWGRQHLRHMNNSKSHVRAKEANSIRCVTMKYSTRHLRASVLVPLTGTWVVVRKDEIIIAINLPPRFSRPAD